MILIKMVFIFPCVMVVQSLEKSNDCIDETFVNDWEFKKNPRSSLQFYSIHISLMILSEYTFVTVWL